jgi:hypothetical protein
MPDAPIPTRIHGILDYIVGLFLIGTPWLFGFNRSGAETWVPAACGISVIAYSLCTDYEWGAIRKLPMPTHLFLDYLNGLIMAVSPWLFGFQRSVWIPFIIVGCVELIVASLSNPVPADRPVPARSTTENPAVQEPVTTPEDEQIDELLEPPLASRKGRAAFSKTQGSEIEDPNGGFDEYKRIKEAERES